MNKEQWMRDVRRGNGTLVRSEFHGREDRVAEFRFHVESHKSNRHWWIDLMLDEGALVTMIEEASKALAKLCARRIRDNANALQAARDAVHAISAEVTR